MVVYTIVSSFKAGRYTVLKLDRNINEKHYSKYRIDGREYPIVPVYDLPLHIAIEADGAYEGKTVECI